MLMYRGPMPYTESDEERFFARAREVGDITEMVRRNRLSLLTAPSGVGKTSALLAGVVPLLRRDHEQELVEGKIHLGPTLVCRSWPGASTSSADSVLLEMLRAAADDLWSDRTRFFRPDLDDEVGVRQRLHEEATRLNAALKSAEAGNSLEVLCGCAEVVGPLVLVFDQFEDVLRSSDYKRVLSIFAEVFLHELRIRILLSFRQEFMMSLHELEIRIGGLVRRTYYLQALREEAIRDVIRLPAALNEISITDDAVNTIKSWLAGDGSAPSEGTETPDPALLSLQALLADIQDFVDQHRIASIDSSFLTAYAQWRNVQPRQLAAHSMTLHIEKVLSHAWNPSSFDKFARGATSADKLNLLRKLFARLAPMFTSGSRPGTPGYKNSVRFVSLVQEALRGDLEMLGVKLSVDGIALSTPFDLQHLTLEEYPGLAISGTANVSGMARRLGWSVERTIHVLVAALGEVLRRLCFGNVARITGTGPDAVYELVHDGLGPPALSWAHTFQNTPEDAIASMTRISGATFRWRDAALDEGRSIEGVAWSGCVINQQQFNRVVFERCDFTATVFRNCSFVGCAFIDCKLDSLVLDRCKFLPSQVPEEKVFSISRCFLAAALINNCHFYAATIESSRLDGTVFAGNDVFGRLDFRRCSLELVTFRDCVLSDIGGSVEEGIFVDECDVVFTRIVSGSGAPTPLFLEGSNLIFPSDRALLTADPQRRYS